MKAPIDLVIGQPADLPAVADVMADAFDPRFGEAWTASQCLGMLALAGVWLTLAIRDDELIGFALSRVVAGDGELLLLAVRPQRRRTGVASTLIRAVIADARSRGAQRIHLEVRAGNPAVGFYHKHGFTKVGERKDYYRGISGEMFAAETYSLGLVD